ncbi:tyrosine-type recombinase/integrase [Candidatus Palauibacter sp.]|uniref:tyrosine-type recombinase/integrase n=1 Tax=Candidatus Palauibacter sp. TaxID=3101350 RepID=UPI003CC5D396
MGGTWSYSVGEYGNRVRVYERTPGGTLYLSIADPTRPGCYLRRSLGHRDRREAMCEADEASAALRRQADRMRYGRTTWAELLSLYERYHLPNVSAHHRQATRRRLAMWIRFLGAEKDPSRLSRHDWEAFIAARRTGTIDAYGRVRRRPVPVRPVTVIRDLECLRAVCRWAVSWRTESGPLLERDPSYGLVSPEDKNPRRPVVGPDRLRRIRAVADRVMTKFRWGPEPRHRVSYLPELLDIAAGTGRRIGAIRKLWYEDLRLANTPECPWGAIRWRAKTDKTGREMVVPVSPVVRGALDRIMADRPGVGAAFVFPAPADPTKPVTQVTVDNWLKRAEREAGMRRLDGGLWHPYRRMWATERKHMPLADLARAGGWASQQTLQSCYLHDDPETTLRVVLNEAASGRVGTAFGTSDS